MEVCEIKVTKTIDAAIFKKREGQEWIIKANEVCVAGLLYEKGAVIITRVV